MLLADKGYDSKKFRQALRARHIKANIAHRQYVKRKRKPGRPPTYDKELGKTRFVVERTLNCLILQRLSRNTNVY
ncbi:MAG: transposase [Patescibacteria group bacterium]